MKKLKACIVGLGRQSIEDHIPGVLESEFAVLTAINDVDRSLVKRWSKKLDVPGYTSLSRMVKACKPDFLIAAVPHDAYKEVIEFAAKNKLHVLKEKPFAMNLKEAIYLKGLVEKSGIQVMMTLQRRFNPIFSTFFQLKDQIGTPFFVEGKYSLFIKWPHKGWRGKRRKAGGGCILDMGYHLIDLLIWYFGLPDYIHAEFSSKAKPEKDYDAEDTAIVLFRFKKEQIFGNLVISRFLPPKTEFLKVIGTRGIIEVKRGEIKRLKSNGEVVETLTRENAWPSAATTQIDFFCKVIQGEKKNIGSPAYHLNHMAFTEACYISNKESKYINPKALLRKYAKK